MVVLTAAMVMQKHRGIGDISHIKNLNSWGSELHDISLIQGMPSLEVVSLSVNNIDDLSDFAHCPRLQELYLRRNKICDLVQILHLQNLRSLRVLWLSDNPCADVPNYRQIVLAVLPNLIKLDNQDITPTEKRKALARRQELLAQLERLSMSGPRRIPRVDEEPAMAPLPPPPQQQHAAAPVPVAPTAVARPQRKFGQGPQAGISVQIPADDVAVRPGASVPDFPKSHMEQESDTINRRLVSMLHSPQWQRPIPAAAQQPALAAAAPPEISPPAFSPLPPHQQQHSGVAHAEPARGTGRGGDIQRSLLTAVLTLMAEMDASGLQRVEAESRKLRHGRGH